LTFERLECDELTSPIIDLREQMLKLKDWVFSFFVIAALTGTLFVGLNFLCGWMFVRFPSLLQSPMERITQEANERILRNRSENAVKWLALSDQNELDAYYRELNQKNDETGVGNRLTGLAYEDYIYFKSRPTKGKFFNFRQAGYREVKNQGPWPPDPKYFNIFFFGTSLVMGMGPDWASIPSYFQGRLDSHPVNGKVVKVYNFARPYYFSTQERILFQQLLLDGHVPDLAVFADGPNEFLFHDGRPFRSGAFEQTFQTTGVRASDMEKTLGSLKSMAKSLPLARAAKGLADRIFPSEGSAFVDSMRQETASPELYGRAIDRYLQNKAQIEGIASAYGIAPVFVWLPFSGYKYDLQYHVALNPVFGFGQHEHGVRGYPLMAERRKASNLGTDFLWLGDMQENKKEPLYLDTVHYTAEFSAEIAGEIAGFVITSREASR
jgi:hypothetical protein